MINPYSPNSHGGASHTPWVGTTLRKSSGSSRALPLALPRRGGYWACPSRVSVAPPASGCTTHTMTINGAGTHSHIPRTSDGAGTIHTLLNHHVSCTGSHVDINILPCSRGRPVTGNKQLALLTPAFEPSRAPAQKLWPLQARTPQKLLPTLLPSRGEGRPLTSLSRPVRLALSTRSHTIPVAAQPSTRHSPDPNP